MERRLVPCLPGNPDPCPAGHEADRCPVRLLQPPHTPLRKGLKMSDVNSLNGLISLKMPAVFPRVNLPVHARVVDLGICYKPLSCDAGGAIMQRMDDTNAVEHFTQADLAKRLRRPGNPMTVEYHYYTERKAAMMLRGKSSLSALSPAEQDVVIFREFFVRSFFQKKAKNEEDRRFARMAGLALPAPVSRSTEPLKRVVREIAFEWHDLQKHEGGQRRTWKKSPLAIPSHSAVKGWIRAMEDHDFDPLCLADDYGSEKDEYFLPEELIFLNEAMAEVSSSTKPNFAAIHFRLEGRMKVANEGLAARGQTLLRIPVVETIRNRARAIPDAFQDLGQNGKDRARRNWQPEHGGIDVVRALERVEQDEHKTDLQTLLVDLGIWRMLTKAERKKVKRIRIWITAAIDAASRNIIGLHVSAGAPSLKSAVRVVEMSTRDKTSIARKYGCVTPWDQGGTSELLSVDSASWHVGKDYRITVNDLGTTLFLPPAGEPSMRGFIERWFKTLSSQMLPFFSGRTWGSVAEKGDYDAEAHASVIAKQLTECLVRYIVDGYHNAPHDELNGATPRNRWLELCRDYGVMPGPTGSVRRHIFGTKIERKLSKKGLRGLGLQFQSKELQQIRRQSKYKPVIARFDNWDLGAVSVLHNGHWIEVPCVYPELRGVSVWQWLAAVEKLRLYNEANAEVSRKTFLDTVMWLKQQADMARLEAGIDSPILTEEDYARFERKLDRSFELVEAQTAEEPDLQGEWHPSDDFFDILGVKRVEFKNEQDVDADHLSVATTPIPQPAQSPTVESDAHDAVVQQITDFFNDN
ncbi:hypothetical protein ELH73_07815 [Rhizobium leguminosarum]|nr:hypothetical protein ELH73_07815 [Rhizobium leguminosarum]TBC57096.1 hypothetical protein ELH32_08250 [Rhizobium ruizarguesonis]